MKMKKLILPLLILTIFSSCECNTFKYDIQVSYTNGEKDTITVTGSNCNDNNLFLNNGCIYKRYLTGRYEANYQGCVVCGVRSFHKLKN